MIIIMNQFERENKQYDLQYNNERKKNTISLTVENNNHIFDKFLA